MSSVCFEVCRFVLRAQVLGVPGFGVSGLGFRIEDLGFRV